MLSLAARRLFLLVPNLVLLTFVVFAGMISWLGSPSTIMLGQDASPAAVRELDARYGFDQPVAVQYVRWIAAAAQGDLGRSVSTQQPVASMLSPAIPVTLELGLACILLALLVSLLANSIATGARIVQPLISAISVVGVTIPNFMLGAVLIYLFSVRLRWLPTTGWSPWSAGIGTHLMHMIMPVLTLSSFYACSFGLVYRAEYRATARLLFVRAARAKGLSETRVSYRHVLPNAVLPVITYAGLSLGQLVGGAVVTETIFSMPGIGRLLVSSVGSYDYPVILALTLLILVGVALANLGADLLYARVNPQVRV